MWQAIIFLFRLSQGGEHHWQCKALFIDGLVNLWCVFALNGGVASGEGIEQDSFSRYLLHEFQQTIRLDHVIERAETKHGIKTSFLQVFQIIKRIVYFEVIAGFCDLCLLEQFFSPLDGLFFRVDTLNKLCSHFKSGVGKRSHMRSDIENSFTFQTTLVASQKIIDPGIEACKVIRNSPAALPGFGRQERRVFGDDNGNFLHGGP